MNKTWWHTQKKTPIKTKKERKQHKTNKAKTTLPPSAQNQMKNGLSLLHQRNNQLTFLPEIFSSDIFDRWHQKYSQKQSIND